ncbi:MAG: Fe-S cluster assembly protein SufD [Thiomonas sp.]
MSAVEALLEAFARLRTPVPLDALRQEAAQRLRARGLPTRHDEDWKYTTLRLLDSLPLDADTPSQPVSAANLAALGAIASDAPRLVFVDGRLDAALSSREALPVGVRAWSAAHAADAELLAAVSDDAFDAVNRMFAASGLDLELPAGARLDAPLVVISVQTRAGGSHLRHRLRLGAGAQVRLIVQHLALPDAGGYLASDFSRITLGDGARLELIRLQAEGEPAAHVSQLHVTQRAGSSFDLQALVTGAALSRLECAVVHDGRDCSTALQAAAVLREAQHADLHWRIAHAKPGGKSQTRVHTVVDDEAHAVFTGRVDVLPGADKTDAAMINRNLLLSPRAEVDTRPQLQIDADDVRCSHGATVGQLDAEALFYLAARGIDAALARQMLIRAFLAQALPALDSPDLVAVVRAQLSRQGLALTDWDEAVR